MIEGPHDKVAVGSRAGGGGDKEAYPIMPAERLVHACTFSLNLPHLIRLYSERECHQVVFVDPVLSGNS